MKVKRKEASTPNCEVSLASHTYLSLHWESHIVLVCGDRLKGRLKPQRAFQSSQEEKYHQMEYLGHMLGQCF